MLNNRQLRDKVHRKRNTVSNTDVNIYRLILDTKYKGSDKKTLQLAILYYTDKTFVARKSLFSRGDAITFQNLPTDDRKAIISALQKALPKLHTTLLNDIFANTHYVILDNGKHLATLCLNRVGLLDENYANTDVIEENNLLIGNVASQKMLDIYHGVEKGDILVGTTDVTTKDMVNDFTHILLMARDLQLQSNVTPYGYLPLQIGMELYQNKKTVMEKNKQ